MEQKFFESNRETGVELWQIGHDFVDQQSTPLPIPEHVPLPTCNADGKKVSFDTGIPA